MSNFRRFYQSSRGRFGYFGLFGAATCAIVNVALRYCDSVQGVDNFSNHTRQQCRKHLLSGMHEPFISTELHQIELFQRHFPDHAFLFHAALLTLKQKHALKTPVKIRAIKEFPVLPSTPLHATNTLVVGGPPALVTGVSMMKSGNFVTYINDERRIPIAYGSCRHLEQDAATQAPTNYRPTRFVVDQIKRAIIGYTSYLSIEQTGDFPWRTLDWFGWLSHPGHWLAGLKVFLGFQMLTMFDDRSTTLQRVAAQCVANELFYEQLNQELHGKLLLRGKESITIARTPDEVSELNTMKTALEAEGRTLKILSNEDMINRYGFLPNGLMYGEKLHDRVLVSYFMDILKDYIVEQGGKVIDATLTTIYKDERQSGGIAEYQSFNGQKHYIRFSRLILSLGSQPIVHQNNKPLFDIVSARGVSLLVLAYVPIGYRLPPALLCGGTNHVTKLSENPVRIKTDDGQSHDLYLMRITSGACITPNVSDDNTANYDSTIATGALAAVRTMLGNQCKIEPLTVYGCNRQVSRYGETRWIEPFHGIHVQYGAGGGGLSRAPELVAKPMVNEAPSC